MVAVLFVLLDLFHHSCQAYNKFLCHTLDSVWVFAFSTCLFFGTLLFQMHCSYGSDHGRLGTLQLLQRRETCSLWLTWFVSGFDCKKVPSPPPSLPP